MEIELISRENIKPCFPTPHQLKHYKISLLDQMMAPILVPVVIYFRAHPDNKNRVENFIFESTKTLKQSLSQILTRFYPFAGRINDPFSVECNDEGFMFVTTRIKSNLSDFLKKPDQKGNFCLLPCRLDWSELGLGSYPAMVQVNYFDCGGMAFGFVFSHKIADGMTISCFIKSWSLFVYSGCTKAVCPNYIAQSFFPQSKSIENEPILGSIMMRYLKFGKGIIRRYVFDSRAISTLREKTGDVHNPSRVELVSSFLWKCFISANKSDAKISLMNQAVNLRKRSTPPFPENCFGNFLWLAPTFTRTTNSENDMGNLVRKFRNTVRKLDGDFITRMSKGFSGYCKNIEETWSELPDEHAELLTVTSWCNFDLYDVDFGWGKPVWLNNCGGGGESACPYMNVVWLMDTKNRDGIEAWVSLEERYMNAFDDIEELRNLAIINPSPFDM